MIDEKKRIFFIIFLVFLAASVFAIYSVIFLYFWPALSDAFFKDKEIWLVISVIILRIITYIVMAIFLFIKWIKQEKIYLSDAYFLFGAFFSIYAIAKALDLFWNLAYRSEHFSDDFLFLVLKIRYFLIILTALPMLFLGFEVILSYIEINKEKNWTKRQKNFYKIIIILLYSGFASFLIIVAPNLAFLLIVMPLVALGTFIGIVFMFLFMYKNKRLSQANGLIIGIGFIFAIINSFIRAFANIIGATSGILIVEILDFIIYIIVFIGFITKPKYAN